MANKLELTWYGKDEPIRIEGLVGRWAITHTLTAKFAWTR